MIHCRLWALPELQSLQIPRRELSFSGYGVWIWSCSLPWAFQSWFRLCLSNIIHESLTFSIWKVAQASQPKFFRFLVTGNLHCPQHVQVFHQTIVLGFPTDINKMLTKRTRKTLLSKPNTFTEIWLFFQTSLNIWACQGFRCHPS